MCIGRCTNEYVMLFRRYISSCIVWLCSHVSLSLDVTKTIFKVNMLKRATVHCGENSSQILVYVVLNRLQSDRGIICVQTIRFFFQYYVHFILVEIIA